nr:hypothetical protein [Mycoplasmopsis bovis]
MNLDLEAGKNDNDNSDSRTKVILPEMPKNDKFFKNDSPNK